MIAGRLAPALPGPLWATDLLRDSGSFTAAGAYSFLLFTKIRILVNPRQCAEAYFATSAAGSDAQALLFCAMKRVL